MDLLSKIIVCFLAGAGAGIGTGFAGMSAATVIGPLLSVFLHIPAYQAIGIGLASDVLASAVSAWTYRKSGNLDIRGSLPLLFSVLAMTVCGSFIADLLPERTMSNTMQYVMLFVGLRFLLKPVQRTKEQMREEDPKKRVIKAVIGGSVVGLICGFVGAGGGMMLLFVLAAVLGYQLHMAVGTSVFLMAFTALTGGISHFVVAGIPDLMCLCLCMVFTFVWARIASVIANRVNAKTLNRMVGIVILITAIAVLLFR